MSHSPARQRMTVRLAHLFLALPAGALVYAPEAIALELRPILQISLFPLLALTGVWMWQGPRLRRLLSRQAPATGHKDRPGGNAR